MARGRPPNPNPASALEVHIDPQLRARLDLLLFSEAEGRVPKGAYQRFFNMLLTTALDWKVLDLSPYAGTLPNELLLRGDVDAVKMAEYLLTTRSRS